MRRMLLTATVTASLLAGPVMARQQDKPVTNRNPDAMDVAKTPVTDLNVGRDGEIPPVLTAAVADPYTLTGLRKCSQLASAIGGLDEVLGPDIDLPQEERDRISSGRVAKWVVSSFIPFRGLIREVSGANAQDKKVNAAIQAGVARRGFLKGVGAARGCKYPASPAPPAVVQAHLERLRAEDGKDKKNDKGDKNDKGVSYTAEPVVQPIP
ncbi:hypothetical protein [Novosphingobium mangrovi (ex Huang et al. 2023)]|uniref:Uncharacterized protein n=1 Tax=Novosphingobium mangrovi (ex Huang et al. 2023) TaxID=2976432 RepID=A0ABT2I797_9SPHN|nr:hypothetical protein [Novosphingobium mangrovi (ex Huang et al. 2023)]MCT2400690.1 hypothetical protein [Novosphingobium mangrovi (ex Huang et al. 2023)]